MSFYGLGKFYGGGVTTGTFYTEGPLGLLSGVPSGLTAYQNVDSSVVLYWGFEPCAQDFSLFTWEVDTDTDPSFSSMDLLSYTSVANPNFIQGYIHAGMSVPTYPRAQGKQTPMYWRVRGTLSTDVSPWALSIFNIPEAVDVQVADGMLATLPDVIYKKDFTDGPSNLYRIYSAAGAELDARNMDSILAGNDTYTASVRDKSLQANFGDLLQVKRPSGMKMIDYREILRTLMAQANSSPSVASVKAVVASMFCEDPTITLIRDGIDMYVDDPTSSPPVLEFYVDDPGSSPTVDPGTVWDDANLAFGVIITINNPLSVPLTVDFVSSVVRKVIPAFAPVYIVGL